MWGVGTYTLIFERRRALVVISSLISPRPSLSLLATSREDLHQTGKKSHIQPHDLLTFLHIYSYTYVYIYCTHVYIHIYIYLYIYIYGERETRQIDVGLTGESRSSEDKKSLHDPLIAMHAGRRL